MEKEEWQTVTGEKKKKKKTEEPTNTTTSFSSPSSLANADDTQKKNMVLGQIKLHIIHNLQI